MYKCNHLYPSASKDVGLAQYILRSHGICVALKLLLTFSNHERENIQEKKKKKKDTTLHNLFLKTATPTPKIYNTIPPPSTPTRGKKNSSSDFYPLESDKKASTSGSSKFDSLARSKGVLLCPSTACGSAPLVRSNLAATAFPFRIHR